MTYLVYLCVLRKPFYHAKYVLHLNQSSFFFPNHGG